MSFHNWYFLAELDPVSARNTHIQLHATIAVSLERRALVTHAVAENLERVALAARATWSLAVDATQGRIAITWAGNAHPTTIHGLMTAALASAGVPLRKHT
jgi:hypothetical protein